MKSLHAAMLILGLGTTSLSFSQPQAQVVGKVVGDFGQPMSKISLRISYVGSVVSDRNGEFFLNLPTGIGPGMSIEFVLNNDTLAIFEPSHGLWNVPKNPLTQPVKLRLLPKGDHRLLNRVEMKAVINMLISDAVKKEAQRLQVQVSKLEQRLASAPQDPLAEEAQRLGFNKEQLLAAIEMVKMQLQESANPYDVGLAALYEKHYGKAAQLIEKAIAVSEKKIHEGKREAELLPEKYLNLGNARAGEHKFKEAVAAYEKAIALQPEGSEGYFLLGNVLYAMGDTKGVMKNWKKALVIYRDKSLGKASANEAAALGNLGIVFRDLGQPDSALAYHREALKITHEIGHRQGESNQLGNLGLVFSALGRLDSAQFYHQAALKIARVIDYRQGVAAHLGNLGLVFSALGQPDSARVYHQAALKIAREIGYQQCEASQLGNLGLVFIALGQLDSARFYHQAALKIARVIEYRQGVETQLGNLGLVFRDLGMPDSARVYHQAALKIAREIGYRQGESADLDNLGVVFRDLGQPDSALVYHKAALKIAREIHYPQYETNQLGNLGVVFLALGQLDSARIYYQAALKIAREIRYRYGVATSLNNLGFVFIELEQPDSAQVYYQAGLGIFREIGDRQGEAVSLNNLGFALRVLGKPDSGRIYNQVALKIDREIGFRLGEANALSNIGLVFRDLGRPDSALIFHQMGLKINLEIGYREGQASDLSNLAMVFGDLEKIDSACVYLKAAIKIHRGIGNRLGTMRDLKNLSFLYHEKQFNFTKAFAISQQRLQLDTSNTLAQCDFAEKHFTTSRFAECERRLSVLLAYAKVNISNKIAVLAISIANLLALNKLKQVPAQLDTLQTAIASQPDSFQVSWTFNGTKHFISQNEKVAPYRAWLVQLFQALEIKEGRKAMLAALQEAREKFEAVAGKRE